MRSSLNGSREWKSELEPEAGWRLQQLGVQLLCSHSQFLFKLFGWNTHSSIFSVFLLHIFLFLSASAPLQLTALALLSHSVLKFYVCFRYF